MGKPGGFFKRLHSKQKRNVSRQQRGTKGASKEERQRKRQEQSIFFAAKREAEQLAVVSSSDDDIDIDALSTDSDEVRERRMKGVKKLRSVLGVSSTSSRRRKNDVNVPLFSEKALMEDEEEKVESSALPLRNKEGYSRSKKNRIHSSSREEDELSKGEESIGEEDDEDWRHFVGDGESEEEEEEEEDGGLLADWGGDEEEEDNDEEENSVDNPLFSFGEKAIDDPEDNVYDDVLDFDDPIEEGEEEDEEDMEEDEEEEDREEKYVDEDENNSEQEVSSKKTGSKKGEKKKKKEENTLFSLLPQFQWGSSSASTLEASGIVHRCDPWYRKFVLNEPSSSPSSVDSKNAMKPLPLTPLAMEGLLRSYEPYMRKAERDFHTLLSRKEQRLPSFVRKEDYAKLTPANVGVDCTAAALGTVSHLPFDPTAVSTWAEQGGGSKTTASGAGTTPLSEESLESQVASKMPPYLHPTLWKKWKAYREQRENLPTFTVEERGILDLLQSYADLLDTTRQWQKTKSRRDIFALHLLNHWFKAKSVVAAHDKMLREWKQRKNEGARKKSQKNKIVPTLKKNSSTGIDRDDRRASNAENSTASKSCNEKEASKKRKKSTKKATENDGVSDERDDSEEEEVVDVDDYELRDRGFTKTRLLLLLPLRNHAYQYLSTFVEILGADPNECSKLRTFQDDFTELEEAMDPTFRRRPRDYQREFEGNIDDNFCVGLRLFPHKVDVYAHPLNSDIIIASPLGLRRRIEKNGDALTSLSSIEVCVVDEAQMLLEQNWAHVAVVLEEVLNLRPTDTTQGLSDLRRTYSWALENESSLHRQTVICSDICSASVLSTFREMRNSWGRIRLYNKHEDGILAQVKVPVQQHFVRYALQSLTSADDEKLEYFTKHIFPSRINPLAEQDVRIIIYVPSYFDFVRLRTFLYKEYRDTFAAISEYSSLKQQRKALGQFTHLERPVLLVTERFYYFKRYFVSMSEVVVFYSPPLIPSFYLSFVNRLVAESPNVFSLCIFSRFDIHELVRIVGTQKAQQLLQRESSVYSFVTS